MRPAYFVQSVWFDWDHDSIDLGPTPYNTDVPATYNDNCTGWYCAI